MNETQKTVTELVSEWWKLTPAIDKDNFLEMDMSDLEVHLGFDIPECPPADSIKVSDYTVVNGMVTEVTFERDEAPHF